MTMGINHNYLIIFLNNISALDILLLDFKYLWSLMVSKETSFSFILKILNDLIALEGTIG